VHVELPEVHFAVPLGFTVPYNAGMRQDTQHPNPTQRCPPAPTCHAGPSSSPYPRTARRQADSGARGATFYSILLEFWLTDSDEPLPTGPVAGVADRPQAPSQTALQTMW
jgi:hypothetical protein